MACLLFLQQSTLPCASAAVPFACAGKKREQKSDPPLMISDALITCLSTPLNSTLGSDFRPEKSNTETKNLNHPMRMESCLPNISRISNLLIGGSHLIDFLESLGF
jgi:hypothetical protein